MKKLINSIITCALFFTISTNAQWSSKERIKGNGNVTTEKRTTASYDEIKVSGSFDVELVAGKEGDITIKGEENLLLYIKIEVEGSTLKIYHDKYKNINTTKKMVVTVPVESISNVSLGGSGSVIGKSTIKADHLSTILSGSGKIILTVEAKDVSTSLSGSGDVTLKGKSTNYESKLSGSGDINSYDLTAENAEAVISGSGNIRLFCTDNLKAKISGSGNIDYKGNPRTKDNKVNGLGKISKS